MTIGRGDGNFLPRTTENIYDCEEFGKERNYMKRNINIAHAANAIPLAVCRITGTPHLSGAFCLVLQSRSYGYAPSSQDKNRSEICDPSVNKYWGTGSNSLTYDQ